MKARWDRIRSTGAWRVWQRYADARGNVLAAGIAYFSFFSLFPAFALAEHAASTTAGAEVEYFNRNVPGFVKS